MNFYKLKFAISLLIVVLFASCKKDVDSTVVVDFDKPMVNVKENGGAFAVSLKVTGEHKKDIKVKAKIDPYGSYPAIEGTHYTVTYDEATISSSTNNGYFTFRTIDNEESDGYHQFKISIIAENIKGAKPGTITECIVTIKDDETAYYERLISSYHMAFQNDKGKSNAFTVEIKGDEEGGPAYDKSLYLDGVQGLSWAKTRIEMDFVNLGGGLGYVEIPFGALVISDIDLGFETNSDVYIAGMNADGSPNFDGQIRGTWNNDFTKVTFEEDLPIYGFITPTGEMDFSSKRVWFCYKDIVLTKK